MKEEAMDVLDNVAIGMTAETTTTVSPEMTVVHFVADMPQVYATAMMILHNGEGVRLRDRLASA